MKSNWFLYVVIGVLVIILVATNITGVKVNTVRGDLSDVQAQLAQTQTATEPAATEEASVATSESTAVPTVTPTAIATEGAPAQLTVQDARIQHLLNLQPSYASGGWEKWLRAAGVEFDTSKVESRQPLEEMLNGNLTVVGLVIRATGMKVSWPACVTTDRPNEVVTSDATRQHQPDLQNPSVMYTNVTLNGQGTIYADCSDWGQLDPTK